MNEIIKEQNQKDLKRYRLIIAATFVVTLVIALIVGISTMDKLVMEAKSANVFLSVLMPKSIEGNSNEGESAYTYGMVFYREKNNDYDPINDEPIQAFNYYYKNDEGKRIDLENGLYYPADYYNENKDVSPVSVYAGFYFQAMDNWKTVKKVLNAVAGVIVAALVVFAIRLWYLSWRRREIAKTQRKNN